MKKFLMSMAAVAMCASMMSCGGSQKSEETEQDAAVEAAEESVDLSQMSIEERAEYYCEDALRVLAEKDMPAFEKNNDEVAAWLETLSEELQDSAKAVLDQYNDTIGRTYFALKRELSENSQKADTTQAPM